jgi:hypothetical protein
MRTLRLSILLPAAALIALPMLASANCYSVYDGQNRLTFQSSVAPIDLSERISDAMKAHFPGRFLVILPDDSDCVEFRSGSTVSPRFDAGAGDRDKTFEAPLLRGAKAPIDSLASGSTGRESVRTGNALNVRRRAP